jgi:hypothetical protein
MKPTALALLAASTILAFSVLAQDAASPKGIFRDPATSATKNGIAYRIFLARGDNRHEVSVRHHFRTGDRFKLQLKLKDPAYVYVLNRTFNGEPKDQDDRGITRVRDEDRDHHEHGRPAYTLLFPAPGERPQKIAAGHYRDIPGDVLLRMDENAGLEKLYVIVSDHELELRKTYGRAIKNLGHDRDHDNDADSADDATDRLNKDLADWASDAQTEGPSASDEEESSKGIERDSYTVGDRSKPFMAEITLHHYNN